MKKTVILVLILAFTLTFCACQANKPAKLPDAGNNGSGTSSPEKSVNENSVTVPTIDYFAEDGGVSKDWICPENSIYRFLTESNYEGFDVLSLTHQSGGQSPGDLPPADSVKQDERNIKNTDITLSFSTKEPYVMYFLVFDESGKETLVLISYDGGITDNSLVLVLETDFGTAENFYNTVFGEQPFTAKVIADFNVTAFHARYLGVLRAQDKTDLLVTDGKEENPNKNKYYMGYFGNPDDYDFGNYMYSNLIPDKSSPENDALATRGRIIELLALFGVENIIE
ncbi:MAG: hypothetical protein IKC06_05530 [Clostridia bacterium]|nr:hypothetical protein [Clostridia bacterium]